MPPLSSNLIRVRSVQSGRTFTIVFVVLALVVVAACLISLYIVPRWRKKRLNSSLPTKPDNLSLPRHNETGSTSRQTFPSHPAILRGLNSKQPSRELYRYDPRTETPFANGPLMSDSISLPAIKLDHSSSLNLRGHNDSQGLFSPVKNPTTQHPRGRPYSIPRTPGTLSELAEYGTTVREFGDAKDYILALPEPLALKARPAGRAPPLTQQLDQFPMPRSAPGSGGKLEHPNRLFAKLQEVDEQQKRSGNRSQYPITDTETGSDTSESSPQSSLFGPQIYLELRNQMTFVDQKSIISAKADIQPTTTIGTKDSSSKRSYWKSFGDKHYQNRSGELARSGTVTRPKTPVAEIRDVYNRRAPGFISKFPKNPSLRKNFTPSTEPLTASVSADSGPPATSTAPTSLELVSSNKLPLLPMPLRPRRAYLHASAETPTPAPAQLRGATPSSIALRESPDKLAPLRKSLRSKRQQRRSIGFYHARNACPETVGIASGTDSRSTLQAVEPRPIKLNLKRQLGVQSPIRRNRSHSMSSVGSMLAPLVAKNPARHSAQASSIYSRDTKGMSLVRTPVSPSFSIELAIQEESVHDASTPKRANSVDLVRSKIDEWDLHTGDLDLSNSLSTALKRTMSDQGPRSPAALLIREDNLGLPAPIGLGISIPKILIGRTSDDIFRDDIRQVPSSGKVLKNVIDVEMSGSESNMSSVFGKSAPGGAEWI